MAIGALQNEGDLKRFVEKILRIPGVLPPAASQPTSGTETVEFPGGANASNAVEVTHGFVFAPKVTAQVVSGSIGAYAEVFEKGDSSFKLRAQDPFAKPEAGVKVEIDWQATV